jgi:hypothetical protein
MGGKKTSFNFHKLLAEEAAEPLAIKDVRQASQRSTFPTTVSALA